MIQIPTLHIASQSGNGIIVRVIDGETVMPHRHLHRDDYYGFCLMREGQVRANIDFQERVIGGHTVSCMLPGQVHQFLEMTDARGFILFVDGVILGDENQRAMRRYALRQSIMNVDARRENELASLFGMLVTRIESPSARNFARTIIDIFAEVFNENDCTEKVNQHHREVFLRFVELLDTHITENRLPSYYANLLNITTGYLNEIVTSCIGISTNQYIQQGIVLRMKRELAFSSATNQQIAWQLGFSDYTYFSRLFSKTTGISPSEFRAKNHE